MITSELDRVEKRTKEEREGGWREGGQGPVESQEIGKITHAYIYIYTHVHACMYAYMDACLHSYIRACVRTYIHTYKHTYIRIWLFGVEHNYGKGPLR